MSKKGTKQAGDDLLSVALHAIGASAAIDKKGRIIAITREALALLGSQKTTESAAGTDIRALVVHSRSLVEYINKKCLSKKRGTSEQAFEIEGPLESMMVSVKGHVTVDGCLLQFENVKKSGDLDKIKAEFVSMASHQLRTPLTAIRWYLEELYDGELGTMTADQKEYVKSALDSNIRMIKLIKNLLNIARLEDKRLTVNPESTDLVALIKDVVAEHKPLARAKNCDVIFHNPDGKMPKIKIDPALIRQVIVNLVSNAIKYSIGTKKDTKVHVRIQKRKRDLVVSVLDAGVGVPRHLQHHVFEKFFRADNVFKMQAEGTGLGLYIAKLIVETSGGSIWFESAEGKGSTFSFALPLTGSKARKGERTLA